MSSLALSQLLLAVTLPLLELEPTFVPTAQSELSPYGGKSGQQLNQYSGEGECRANHSGTSLCTCHPGYQWNATLCSLYPHCWGRRSERDSCMCRSFHGPVTGYCQLLPPVPANLILDSQLQMHGNTLNLILLKKEEATNLRWFLRHSKNHTPISLWPGTNVLQTSSEGQSGLRVARMSRHWAGHK